MNLLFFECKLVWVKKNVNEFKLWETALKFKKQSFVISLFEYYHFNADASKGSTDRDETQTDENVIGQMPNIENDDKIQDTGDGPEFCAVEEVYAGVWK